jgi:hypothetical protein
MSLTVQTGLSIVKAQSDRTVCISASRAGADGCAPLVRLRLGDLPEPLLGVQGRVLRTDRGLVREALRLGVSRHPMAGQPAPSYGSRVCSIVSA